MATKEDSRYGGPILKKKKSFYFVAEISINFPRNFNRLVGGYDLDQDFFLLEN